MTIKERWTQVVKNGWHRAPDGAHAAVIRALVVAEESGNPSCLFHEIHKWTRANVVLPECPHCDGPADPRLGFHNLCAEYVKRGMPITRKLDVRSDCACAPCQRERERN